MHHEYKPLLQNKERPEIRLVELLSCDSSGDLHVRIHTTPIDEAPPYLAISYLWGSGELDNYILIQGDGGGASGSSGNVPLHVTKNLHLGLRRILEQVSAPGRDSETLPRLIWADAICINQQDPEEKKIQIPLMSRIFGGAEKTVAWLGDPVSPDVERLYQNLNDVLYKEVYRPLYSNQQVKMQIKRTAIAVYLERKYPGRLDSLSEILLNPWFSRVWVQQEIITAKNVVGLYGTFLFSWDTLARNSHLIEGLGQDARNTLGLWYSGNKLANLRRDTQNGLKMTHLELLVHLRDLEATLDRDFIYSLTSLASDADLLDIIIDYSNAVSDSDVYINFASRVIVKHRSLNILGARRVLKHGKAEGRQFLKLPTWVPDWRVNASTMSILEYSTMEKFAAGGQEEPAFKFLDRLRLRLEGVFVPIKEVGEVLPSTFGQDASESVKSVRQTDTSGNYIAEPFVFARTLREWEIDPKAKYFTGEQNFDVFCSLLIPDYYGKLKGNERRRDTISYAIKFFQSEEIPKKDFAYKALRFFRLTSATTRLMIDFFLRGGITSVPDKTPYTCGRRLALSPCGALSVVPRLSTSTDRIFFTRGCDFPIVVRQQEDGSYILLDTAYTHGYMHGEVWKSDYGKQVEDIELA